MYNRYIPSTDGGYICQRIEEHPRGNHQKPPALQAQDVPQHPHKNQLKISTDSAPSKESGFLRNLLKKDIELDDILILLILLLLLLDRDEGEEGNDTLTALLTAAAFLILQ